MRSLSQRSIQNQIGPNEAAWLKRRNVLNIESSLVLDERDLIKIDFANVKRVDKLFLRNVNKMEDSIIAVSPFAVSLRCNSIICGANVSMTNESAITLIQCLPLNCSIYLMKPSLMKHSFRFEIHFDSREGSLNLAACDAILASFMLKRLTGLKKLELFDIMSELQATDILLHKETLEELQFPVAMLDHIRDSELLEELWGKVKVLTRSLQLVGNATIQSNILSRVAPVLQKHLYEKLLLNGWEFDATERLLRIANLSSLLLMFLSVPGYSIDTLHVDYPLPNDIISLLLTAAKHNSSAITSLTVGSLMEPTLRQLLPHLALQRFELHSWYDTDSEEMIRLLLEGGSGATLKEFSWTNREFDFRTQELQRLLLLEKISVQSASISEEKLVKCLRVMPLLKEVSIPCCVDKTLRLKVPQHVNLAAEVPLTWWNKVLLDSPLGGVVGHLLQSQRQPFELTVRHLESLTHLSQLPLTVTKLAVHGAELHDAKLITRLFSTWRQLQQINSWASSCRWLIDKTHKQFKIWKIFPNALEMVAAVRSITPVETLHVLHADTALAYISEMFMLRPKIEVFVVSNTATVELLQFLLESLPYSVRELGVTHTGKSLGADSIAALKTLINSRQHLLAVTVRLSEHALQHFTKAEFDDCRRPRLKLRFVDVTNSNVDLFYGTSIYF